MNEYARRDTIHARVAARRVYVQLPGQRGYGIDVANVVHPRAEEDESLEPQTETAVHHGAVPPKVHVPLVLRRFEAGLLHPLLHLVDALLALRAADQLADPRHEQVHRGDRLAARLVVEAHVKRLDILGVVVHDHGLLEHLLREGSVRVRWRGRCPTRRGRPTPSRSPRRWRGYQSPPCTSRDRTRSRRRS